MIDMLSLYEHPDYSSALDAFQKQVNNGECDHTAWGQFKDVHFAVTKDKCPICECLLDNSLSRVTNKGSMPVIATIDHYRPQKYYPFLRCEPTNYILMCSECNNNYKQSDFPLYPDSSNRGKATTYATEQPLIVNPINDNIFKLFELVFRRSSSGRNVLELKPKSGLEEDSYLFLKAMETIKLFGLGDCEQNRHKNDNIHNCRIGLLEMHFDKFYALATARKVGKDEFMVVLSEHPEHRYYGFTKFIAREQFEILVG